MPPKAAVQQARPPSPSPPPPPAPVPTVNDANDILIIQDFMDTIDQIPVELTRVHSDLNELGAVLYSTLCNLERKLHQLIDWVQNPRVPPEQRFQLLQEIAEEAARYKLGGDDKIRVAGGACDGITAHQRHISALLAASTLLEPGPPSPYTAALILPPPPVPVPTRRGGRTTGSPFNDRGTPTKRKKKGKDAAKDDDDASSVTGKDDTRKKSTSKRKKANRAASPTESIASGTYGKTDPAPRTARQIAAAAAKARAAQKAQEETDEETGDDEPRRGKGEPMQVTASSDSLAPTGALGVDLGASREGSAKSGVTGGASDKRRARGTKRGRDEEDEEEEEEAEDEERPAKRSGTTSAAKKAAAVQEDGDIADGEATGGENEVDSNTYCTCRQISYGEMIGCDDSECEIEWYHLACLGLDKTPDGNWICPQCTERRKRNPKAKKAGKSNKRK